jgi:hypothetical protein
LRIHRNKIKDINKRRQKTGKQKLMRKPVQKKIIENKAVYKEVKEKALDASSTIEYALEESLLITAKLDKLIRKGKFSKWSIEEIQGMVDILWDYGCPAHDFLSELEKWSGVKI